MVAARRWGLNGHKPGRPSKDKLSSATTFTGVKELARRYRVSTPTIEVYSLMKRSERGKEGAEFSASGGDPAPFLPASEGPPEGSAAEFSAAARPTLQPYPRGRVRVGESCAGLWYDGGAKGGGVVVAFGASNKTRRLPNKLPCCPQGRPGSGLLGIFSRRAGCPTSACRPADVAPLFRHSPLIPTGAEGGLLAWQARTLHGPATNRAWGRFSCSGAILSAEMGRICRWLVSRLPARTEEGPSRIGGEHAGLLLRLLGGLTWLTDRPRV
jgi:hypothetical protein